MVRAAQHLRSLIVRKNYVEGQLEADGFDRFRAWEVAAIEWALEQLGEQFPEELADAERRAAVIAQIRAERIAAERIAADREGACNDGT